MPNPLRFLLPMTKTQRLSSLAISAQISALLMKRARTPCCAIAMTSINSCLRVGSSTLRQAGDYHNEVHGIDFKYQITDQDKFIGQYLHSDSAYPLGLAAELSGEAKLRASGDELQDSGKLLAYEHENRNWSWYSRYLGLGDEFRADLGYMPQTDFIKVVHGGSYQWFYENPWVNRLEIWSDWDISHNELGELLEKEAEIAVTLYGAYQSENEFKFTQRDRVGSRLESKCIARRCQHAIISRATH